MPKRAEELSALQVKRLTHTGSGQSTTHAVGGVAGLLLQVKASGSRSWLLRVMAGGKRREVGLGPYPDVTLAQARERAREIRDQIWRGGDPVAEKAAQREAAIAAARRALTFAKAVDLYREARAAEFTSDKRAKNWRSALDRYVLPVIGDRAVSGLDVHDVHKVLAPIWTDKAVTAGKLRGWIEGILAWATVAGHRDGPNPARWKNNLDALLPSHGAIVKTAHYPAVALDDAAAFFADLRARGGIATRAVELLALTVVRSGEVRSAAWADIDLDGRLWIIPADKMKGKRREHRVPLTDRTVALLKAIPRTDSPLVFPNRTGEALSDMALSAVLRRMNADREGGYPDPRSGRLAVPHGLRSTFKDWATERTEFPNEMSEVALAHTVGSTVERAYRRGDMLERRRAMMESWGRFLAGEEGAKVVPLNRGGSHG